MTTPTDVPRPAAAPIARAGTEFSPARMMDIELTESLPAVDYDGRQRIWVLGRLHTEPVGTCFVNLSQDGLTADQFAARLWPKFREPVTERLAAARLSSPRLLSGSGLKVDPVAWPFLQLRLEVLAAAPFISVIICTRDRPDQLDTCLRFLGRQAYPRFEVVVVDNAPTSDAVRTLVKANKGGVPFRYVAEPQSGLQRARNAGIAAASGDVIAFLDDDEEPDSHWLAGLARGFARGDDIGCVTGMVLPARLDTQAQELFEQLGGHCKGRGFSSAVFSRHGPQNPLYPLPPFGAGANMAFRREALARIGGFDVALGAGTPALGGGDTLALTLVLLAGYRIAYEPAALTRHHHRRDLDSLGHQLHGYGVGLTAYYAALLRHRPSVLPELLRLVPTATGYVRRAKGPRATAQKDLLARLERQKLRWMLAGPAAYVRSVRLQGRVAASEEPQPSQTR
jgi:O-antigen biosynthesis protein